jgi:hypothetical protein
MGHPAPGGAGADYDAVDHSFEKLTDGLATTGRNPKEPSRTPPNERIELLSQVEGL